MQLDDAGQAALAGAGRVGVGPRSARASPAAAARQPHACRSAPSAPPGRPGRRRGAGSVPRGALEALLAPCGASGPPTPGTPAAYGVAREPEAPASERLDQPVRDQGVEAALPLAGRRGPAAASAARGDGPVVRSRSTASRAPRHLPVGAVPGLTAARRTLVCRSAGALPGAQVGDGAVVAARCPGGADQRPELHHGDVPRARPSRGSAGTSAAARAGSARVSAGAAGRCGPRPRGPARGGRWCRRRWSRSPKAKRGDRRGGVGADPGQGRAARPRSSGTSPPCRSTHRGGRGVQPQRPARVAEPAPGAHRLAGSRRGQVGRASASAPSTRARPARPGRPGSAAT